jgi:ATP-binding cassette subfamily B (MDR/TAP) protein 8
MSLLFGNVVRGLSAGARVFEFINTTPTVPLSGGKKVPFHSLNGHIEFHDVRLVKIIIIKPGLESSTS